MREEIFNEISCNVDEASKFFKFGRKRIAVVIKNQLEEVKKEIKELISSVNEKKNAIAELTAENASQKETITELTKENESKKCLIKKLELKNSDSTTKLQLISNILSAKGIENDSFIKFRALIQNEFIEFANSESSLKEEAEAILRLQLIEKQIKKMLNFSGILDKKIIAIGGGFSAGKSEFISSFFKDTEIKLPIGIKPVTAIPTYITSSANNRIKAFTQKGGSVPIDPVLYKELSHDFVKSFKFNLKEIMPAMSIETPLNYEDICFIDTPGYNPSDTCERFANEDINTAKEYLEQANVLLWLVGLDSNGTISATDLEFIEKLSLENKKLYFVANKADLKSHDDIDDILDNFEETLNIADIEYSGISAYSSVNVEEIAFRKMSLYHFLDTQNTPIDLHSSIIDDLQKVFNLYDRAINEDIKFTKSIRKDFKSLELDLLETGFDKYGDKISDRINKMRKLFELNDLEKQLQHLKKVKSQILDEVHNIFGKIRIKIEI